MTEDPLNDANYIMGYSGEFQQLLRRRRAETNAAHLLPHLKPGLRVLDFGCGPGSITVGLADAVKPGEVHAIDMEENQIQVARSAAKLGGHQNAIFHTGDVTDLPFEDNFFDVAHCHAVLMHVPDTSATLSEVKRVLKPGGMIASREMIVSASFLAPHEGSVDDAWVVFAKLLAANGGHPEMGSELRDIFTREGFSDVRVGASFDFFGTEEDVSFVHEFISDWFYAPEVMDTAIKIGLATQKQFDRWRQELHDWKAHPGACGGFAFGHVLARKPI